MNLFQCHVSSKRATLQVFEIQTRLDLICFSISANTYSDILKLHTDPSHFTTMRQVPTRSAVLCFTLPVVGQGQMVGHVGQLFRLPHLHVEDNKGRGTVAENPLGELPEPVAAAQHRKWGKVTQSYMSAMDKPQLRSGVCCITFILFPFLTP